MSQQFDPGPGWRVATDDEAADGRETVQHFDVRDGWTNWVRESPVLPLPTTPYTVIRAQLNSGDEADLLLSASGHWGTAYGHAKVWATADDIARVGLITGWKPISEPRAVTAKAVLDRVRDEYQDDDAALRVIGRDFGVES